MKSSGRNIYARADRAGAAKQLIIAAEKEDRGQDHNYQREARSRDRDLSRRRCVTLLGFGGGMLWHQELREDHEREHRDKSEQPTARSGKTDRRAHDDDGQHKQHLSLACELAAKENAERNAAGHFHKGREVMLIHERTERYRLRRPTQTVDSGRICEPLQNSVKAHHRAEDDDEPNCFFQTMPAIYKC